MSTPKHTDVVTYPPDDSAPSSTCNALEVLDAASVFVTGSSTLSDVARDHLAEKDDSNPIIISTGPADLSTNLSAETPKRLTEHLLDDGTHVPLPLAHSESTRIEVPLPASALPERLDVPLSPSCTEASSAPDGSDTDLSVRSLTINVLSAQARDSSTEDSTARAAPRMSSIGVQTELIVVKRGKLAHGVTVSKHVLISLLSYL